MNDFLKAAFEIQMIINAMLTLAYILLKLGLIK